MQWLRRSKWTIAMMALLTAVGVAAPTLFAAEPAIGRGASSTLLDQHANAFTLPQLLGKTVVLNFVFTRCPSVCPTQTAALQRVWRGLPDATRERVHFVSVSIDPQHDTPAALTQFTERFDIDSRHWSFVTGAAEDITALSQSFSARALPEGAAPLGHRTEVRLINAQGQLMQTYSGVPLDEARLVREIQSVDRLFTLGGRQQSPALRSK